MKRAFVVAIGGAALVVGGLAGCSSNKSTSEQVSSATETAKSVVSSAAEAAGGTTAGSPKVTIDGQDQTVTGNVACVNQGGTVQIAIGDAALGIGAQLGEGDSPVVHQVGLGSVNGVALAFQEGAPGGSATATKDGSTYTISGTATGIDLANPTQPLTKPFEITVTCP